MAMVCMVAVCFDESLVQACLGEVIVVVSDLQSPSITFGNMRTSRELDQRFYRQAVVSDTEGKPDAS